MFICLDLEPFFLELSEGSWELDVCHRLIGGLNRRSVQGQLSRNVVTSPDTCSVAMTAAARPCQVPIVPASCERTERITPAIVVQ